MPHAADQRPQILRPSDQELELQVLDDSLVLSTAAAVESAVVEPGANRRVAYHVKEAEAVAHPQRGEGIGRGLVLHKTVWMSIESQHKSRSGDLT